MNTLGAWLIALLAFISALVIITCAIKSRPAWLLKQGLYGSCLAFFLGLFGVDLYADSKVIEQQKLQVKNSEELPSLYPPELATKEKWQAFKKFWRKLAELDKADSIPPKTDEERNARLNMFDQYEDELARIFGFNDTNRFRASFSTIRPSIYPWGTKKGGSQISLMAFILSRICIDRIIFEKHGGLVMSFTRIVTPPAEIFSGYLYDRIEQRIDTLVELRASKTINNEAYLSALEALQKDIYLRVITLTLSSALYFHINPYVKEKAITIPYSHPGEEPKELIELFKLRNWLDGLEKSYQVAINPLKDCLEKQEIPCAAPNFGYVTELKKLKKRVDDVEKSYKKLKADIDLITKLGPNLKALIKDLES